MTTCHDPLYLGIFMFRLTCLLSVFEFVRQTSPEFVSMYSHGRVTTVSWVPPTFPLYSVPISPFPSSILLTTAFPPFPLGPTSQLLVAITIKELLRSFSLIQYIHSPSSFFNSQLVSALIYLPQNVSKAETITHVRVICS